MTSRIYGDMNDFILFLQLEEKELSPWIFLDTKFNINDGEYTWDDGTKIKLEEWLNAHKIGPGNPVIPKWIVLRYFKLENF